jgi:hypothetical protein
MDPWGVLPFENDTALDWIWELEDEKDTFILSDCFAAVVEAEAEEIIEITTAEEALAAAEVLAALLERPLPELPGEVNTYIARLRYKRPSSDLVDLAVEAVERVREESELRARWDATEGAEKWHLAMTDLHARLMGRRGR